MKLELFGLFLKDARTFAKLTQEEVVTVVGCSESAYCAWENGRRWPTFEYMPKLADVLGITVDDIVEGAGHEYTELAMDEREDADDEMNDTHFRNIL
jgi:transcriptional regulator with XRE-family HTH domain